MGGYRRGVKSYLLIIRTANSERVIHFILIEADLVVSKNMKKINRISSDLFDKKTRIDTEEWEGIEEGCVTGWK